MQFGCLAAEITEFPWSQPSSSRKQHELWTRSPSHVVTAHTVLRNLRVATGDVRSSALVSDHGKIMNSPRGKIASRAAAEFSVVGGGNETCSRLAQPLRELHHQTQVCESCRSTVGQPARGASDFLAERNPGELEFTSATVDSGIELRQVPPESLVGSRGGQR